MVYHRAMALDSIDLQTAADSLGVHYQTAYKWVRSGRLPADLIHGQYRINPAEVAKLRSARSRPTKPRARQPRSGDASLASSVFESLLSGTEREVRVQLGSLLSQGWTLTETVDRVVAPALRQIGDEWAAGRVSVPHEHRATAIIDRALGQHHQARRGRRRGVAVVGAVSGELHTLATSMAAIALREDGWSVHHLGAGVPAEDFLQFAREVEADLVVLTVTFARVRPLATSIARDLDE